ncbi:hypothetical protein [Methylobacterium aquaticum]|uniref:hypothetical protein n=1 Tax=Methylobacterium aquaticum TaxID=270351 RepID=UPI001934982A|nr:hypothetical protein [Methylobacterium aquaticum]QRE76182.1 hypothetical protein F1D61_23790 [Methylobacterium aquaticum]
MRQGDWVSNLTYPAATRLTKQGRATDKQGAAEAVRTGLEAALHWHIERDQPLRLCRHDAPDRATDWRQRLPLFLVAGRDVPWPKGWGQTQKARRGVTRAGILVLMRLSDQALAKSNEEEVTFPKGACNHIAQCY